MKKLLTVLLTIMLAVSVQGQYMLYRLGNVYYHNGSAYIKLDTTLIRILGIGSSLDSSKLVTNHDLTIGNNTSNLFLQSNTIKGFQWNSNPNLSAGASIQFIDNVYARIKGNSSMTNIEGTRGIDIYSEDYYQQFLLRIGNMKLTLMSPSNDTLKYRFNNTSYNKTAWMGMATSGELVFSDKNGIKKLSGLQLPLYESDTTVSLIKISTKTRDVNFPNIFDRSYISINSGGNGANTLTLDDVSGVTFAFEINGSSSNVCTIDNSGVLTSNSLIASTIRANTQLNASITFFETGVFFIRSNAVSSASSITVTKTVFHVTGTTQINTIVPIAAGSTVCEIIYIIPDGAFTFGTSNNIAIASTAVIGKMYTLIYDSDTDKWYPSY
jgi:hypothetical protein